MLAPSPDTNSFNKTDVKSDPGGCIPFERYESYRGCLRSGWSSNPHVGPGSRFQFGRWKARVDAWARADIGPYSTREDQHFCGVHEAKVEFDESFCGVHEIA